MNNSTKQPDLTPEQLQQQAERQIQMEKLAEESKRIQEILSETYLPALASQAPKLLEAGKLSERLAQVVQGAFNFKATEITIGELGIVERIAEARKTDPDPTHGSVYDTQSAVFTAMRDVKVADFQQIIQWFGQTANAHAERSASTIPLEDCFTSLRPKTDETTKEAGSPEGAINSPYFGKADNPAGGTASGEGPGDKQP